MKSVNELESVSGEAGEKKLTHSPFIPHGSGLTFRTPGFVSTFGYLLTLQLLRPVFPNLPCLFLTFYLEYPSVLSRYCFLSIMSPNSLVMFQTP